MIGFFLGAACLIGLIKVARGHRWQHGWRHGHSARMACGPSQGAWNSGGCGDSGWQGGGWGRSHEPQDTRGFGGPWMFAHQMADRLNLSDAQRDTLWEAFKAFKNESKHAKESAHKIRADFAKAMRSESFDELSVGEAVGQFESTMDTLRKSTIEAFAKIHSTLEPAQREMVAEMIERGPFARAFRRTAYRGAW